MATVDIFSVNMGAVDQGFVCGKNSAIIDEFVKCFTGVFKIHSGKGHSCLVITIFLHMLEKDDALDVGNELLGGLGGFS
ncbi:hypothetical protein DSO57_1024790 [Entomophthora muscae]|uniref:Uncharacterized protein n=1 Tax=Entomophthora muscae TaxID=34485 RepID=A0ACC2T2K2_9FUNG|nr:hypothetical protein DSO57_1024790 [Entomophthora muscae]